MPLFKRKPFPPVEPPDGLDPDELVFQVRFTKEIFRDYQDYLNRLNLYRQRVWTCKTTGKTNLTYEEALVSEQRATEKVQQFPKEVMGPVLQIIQFSMLRLKDLVNTICKTLQDNLSEGVELLGKKEHSVCRCKILRVMKDKDMVRYEVEWIDPDKNVTGASVVNADDLIRKKLPFTRDILKSFIRESTSQTSPWVIHKDLANKYGLLTMLPEKFQDKVSFQNGCIVRNKINRKRTTLVDDNQGETRKKGRKAVESETTESLATTKKAKKEKEKLKEEIIKYPIDDLLVQPGADDPVFTNRPTPSAHFGVPVDCVGDLLMIWDFCSSFGRSLHLSRFSLNDIDNAICHKDTNLTLIVESHSAILRLLIKDGGEYFNVVQNRKWKSKITLVNWTEYLCAFLEMTCIPEFSTYVTTIKRGYYGLLDTHAKLAILSELVSQALATNATREQLDTYIEQRQTLSATKREVAIEEAKKRREEKQQVKVESDNKNSKNKLILENGGGKLHISENGYHNNKQNGDIAKETDKGVLTYQRRKMGKSSVNTQSRKDSLKQKKEAQEKKDKEHRKDHLQREIEKRFIRTNPLGKDKNYNRYWFFRREGRIFVESSDSKQWGYYSSKEEFDALMGSLNLKGVRERALHRQLEKYFEMISGVLQKRSRDIAQKAAVEEAVVRRSTRVRAPRRDSPAPSFLNYVNKWKDNSSLMD